MSVLTCPVCQGAMRELNQMGILIDTCTQCRGVWLDRGELEKLIALSREEDDQPVPRTQHAPPPPPNYGYDQPRPPAPYRQDERMDQYHHRSGENRDDRYRSSSDYKYDTYGRPYGKRKKSKLESLFDIFD